MGARDDSASTYVSKSPEDMERFMGVLFARQKVKEFVLQEFVQGTEISTEAWFDGERFHALNHTLEEKKLMDGGIGPNTGCAGNILWIPARPTTLYNLGLARTVDALRRVGFVGPIDLNTIATDGEIFGLEWTPRFGYEGTCNLTRLLPIEFGEFLHRVASGQMTDLAQPNYAFAASVRLSVPPYPNPSNPEKYAGVPIDGLDLDRLDSFFLSDACLTKEGKLETIGTDGWIGSPIGCSDSIKGAFDECQVAIDKLMIPDMMYRTDLARCIEKRYTNLQQQGWLRMP